MIKPFLKGFTTAALGANVLVGKDTPDAVHFLGHNYPYFADRPNDASVIAVFERAAEGFGGPEWQEASLRMRDLAEHTGLRATADALIDLTARLHDIRAV